MITPRRTRLLSVPDFPAFQRVIGAIACHRDVARARQTAVIVTTRAAASQLRQTLENILLAPSSSCGAAMGAPYTTLLLPEILTRDDWYGRLHEHLADTRSRLTDIEREALASAAVRETVREGIAPPFTLRPSLVAEILALFDALDRQRQTVAAFEALLSGDLEPSVAIDRGAERLLRQTRFLAAAFRHYRRRVEASGCLDEQGLREALVGRAEPGPFRQLVITGGDRVCDSGGLWPADFDLLTRIPRLDQIDVISTERMLSAGFHERLHELLPGIEEDSQPPGDAGDDRTPRGTAAAGSGPELAAPQCDALYTTYRDRDEELAGIARSLKARWTAAPEPVHAGNGPAERTRLPRHARLGRTAIVFKRPLPYVYLAQTIFGSAGIPYQAFDSLPLAAEPAAAALDLLLTIVASGFARSSTAALLRSPHFTFAVDGRESQPGEAATLDRALAEAAAELAALSGIAPPSVHIATLLRFLDAHDRLPGLADPSRERHLRARAAVRAVLRELVAAHQRYDDEPRGFDEVAARVRRWVESQTFTPRVGSGGIHLVDAQAAPYGDFDEVHLVGLVEHDWPERSPRNIFYPASLLRQFGWVPDEARLASSRAEFRDLLRLPRKRIALSTFVLDEEAIVAPSVLLEDLERAGLPVIRQPEGPRARILVEEALSQDPIRPDCARGPAAGWAVARLERLPASDPRFHGAVTPRRWPGYAISAVEKYIECPFTYFAVHVLGLREDLDDEEVMNPRTRGRFVHQILRAFFDDWQRDGHGLVTPDTLPDARAAFARVAERYLEQLPAAEAEIERGSLLGSPAAPGYGEVVLRAEAGGAVPVVERLLEFRLDGPCRLVRGEESRTLSIRAIADRIDLLADGGLRVIDYKLGAAPNPRHAVQLPIYGVHAEQALDGYRGRQWRFSEAAYLTLGRAPHVVSLFPASGDPQETLADGQARFLDAVDGIERGEFPPRPLERFRCNRCPYAGICRKDYVDGG